MFIYNKLIKKGDPVDPHFKVDHLKKLNAITTRLVLT